MIVQIDSREKPRAISSILAEFDRQGVQHYISKLFCGDYMSLDNPRLVIDRKQNLTELCQNVCQQHDRFRRELIRANEIGVHIVILCEHGEGIKCLEDILFWHNPRSERREKINGKWVTVKTKATTGDTLYRILNTIRNKYSVEFQFCNKNETGRRILEILRND